MPLKKIKNTSKCVFLEVDTCWCVRRHTLAAAPTPAFGIAGGKAAYMSKKNV